jgi:hypothetical protein
MPRQPLADKGMQTSFRLPRELHKRLMAEAGDKGIGEEMRRRLEASFGPEQPVADPKTGELLAAIAEMAGRVSGWQEDPDQFAAFARAINLVLAGFMPAGEPKADNSVLASVLVGSALGRLSPAVGHHLVNDILVEDALDLPVRLTPEAAANLRARLGASPARKEKP